VSTTSDHGSNPKVACKVDQFDWEIIEFVVAWSLYGGPQDEDTVPLFGMDTHRLLRRYNDTVLRLLTDNRPELTVRQHQLLARARSLRAAGTDAHGVNRRSSDPSPIDLTADGGRWIQSQGLWHWQSAAPPNTSTKADWEKL
jgi:hypothetical protein